MQNSYDLDEIKQIILPPYHVIASFDVTNMVTNMPLDLIIHSIPHDPKLL